MGNLWVKFICGFIYSEEESFRKAKCILERKYGKIDFESEVIDFNFTDYYFKEMGQPLFRKFISFEKLKRTTDFIKIKLFCIKIERKLALSGKRRVNIDPGYLNESKLVLTTTKDFSHRLHLGKNIYGEVTLYYQKGNFRDFHYTYPDYRTLKYKDIFVSIREIYRQQISRK